MVLPNFRFIYTIAIFLLTSNQIIQLIHLRDIANKQAGGSYQQANASALKKYESIERFQEMGAFTLQLDKVESLLAMVEWCSTRVTFLAWAAPLCELTAEFKSENLTGKQQSFFKTTRNISTKNQWSRSWISACLSWILKKKNLHLRSLSLGNIYSHIRDT